MENPIQLFKPKLLPEEIFGELAEIMKSGWIGLGPKTEEFESKFAAHVGARYAVAVNSCTAALHLALRVLGIDSRDEVATTSMTFVSTNMAILYQRATPVFLDVCPTTMSIDLDSLKHNLGAKRISAIIVVHYGGQPIDMEPIYQLASNYTIPVIEDAAHAAGARYKDGKAVGSNPYQNGLTCFSFHAVKNLPMGDGGMITTNLATVAERLKRLRWLGINKSTHVRTETVDGKGYNWLYDVGELGYKYHPNDLASVIGLNQLKHLSENNLYRQQIYNWYIKSLNLHNVEFVGGLRPDGSISSRHIIAIKVPKELRDKLICHLNENNIFPGVHYYPNHLYKMFERYRDGALPVVEEEWQRLISLPCHLDLTKEDVQRVSSTINSFLKE